MNRLRDRVTAATAPLKSDLCCCHCKLSCRHVDNDAAASASLLVMVLYFGCQCHQLALSRFIATPRDNRVVQPCNRGTVNSFCPTVITANSHRIMSLDACVHEVGPVILVSCCLRVDTRNYIYIYLYFPSSTVAWLNYAVVARCRNEPRQS